MNYTNPHCDGCANYNRQRCISCPWEPDLPEVDEENEEGGEDYE